MSYFLFLGMVDHWMKDEHRESCVDCKVKFTIYERKHHCRNCGKVFCSSCSQYQAEIPRLKILQPVRVCKSCHDGLTNDKVTKKNLSKSRSASGSKPVKKIKSKDISVAEEETTTVKASDEQVCVVKHS